ncbi:acyltransferase family protein [Lachnospiraceae bacterium JLR.KK008]
MEGKRLDYLDMVKGVGIILVVVGHSSYVPEGVLTWLASFHMPLFFIVSGMLFAHKQSDQEPFGNYVKRRFHGMILPYFWFSLIYLGVDYYYLFVHPQVIDQQFINTAVIQSLSFYGISVLWFLPTIFLGELCLYVLIRKQYPIWLLCVIGFGSVWVPVLGVWLIQTFIKMEKNVFLGWFGSLLMALLRVFPALVFLMIGYGVYCWLCDLRLRAGQEVMVGILCLFLNGAVAFANGRVDMHFLVFHNVFYFYLGACSAAIGLLLIFRHVKKIWLLGFLGSNSLIVMLTHLDCQVMSLAIRFAVGMNQFIPRAKNIIFYLNLYGALLVGELVMIVLVGKVGFFLIGRKKPVKLEGPSWWQRLIKRLRGTKFKRVK